MHDANRESGPASSTVQDLPAARQVEKRRLGLLLKRLSLTFGVLVVTIGLLEIGTRLFSDIRPPLYRSHPTLGMTYQPNSLTTVFVAESGNHVDLRFNRDGMRGPEFKLEKSANVLRIAVIGDSITAAIATDEEDTMVRVLEKKLREQHSGENCEVMNFAISGSSTGQEVVYYRELVKQYNPDVVVCVFFVGNDTTDNCRRFSNHAHRVYFDLNENGELYQIPRSSRKSTITNWLNRNSRFYIWQKHATRIAVHKGKRKANVLPNSKLAFCTEPTDDMKYAWQVTEKLIETFAREVNADGSQFLLAIVPSADQVHDENWNEILKRAGKQASQMDADYPQRRLSAFCERIGVPLVDMLAAFRRASPSHLRKNESEWLHYNGKGHLNIAGNRLAAEEIYSFLGQDMPAVARRQSESVPR